jgi:hypothetical protein
MTFLPGTTDVLVTELPGRLRIIRNGALEPAPVPGWPALSIRAASIRSCCTHASRTIERYLTYAKGKDAQARTPTTVAIARARFDGKALSAVEQIFEATPGVAARRRHARSLVLTACCTSRLVFGQHEQQR